MRRFRLRRSEQVPQPPLIERSEHLSLMQKYGFRALTVVFWLLFLSLFRVAGTPFAWVVSVQSVYELFSYKISSGDFFQQLSVYGFIVLLIGLLLIGWARYNQIRFSRYERRTLFLPPVSAKDIMELYALSEDQIDAGRSRRLLIKHAANGDVRAIRASAGTLTQVNEPVPKKKFQYAYQGCQLRRERDLQWVVIRGDVELFRDGSFEMCRRYVDSLTV